MAHPTLALRPATTEQIRARFPALDRLHRGRPVAYFDGPGGTQAPRAVGDAILDYLYHHNANTHWEYPTSAETDALIAASRETLADFLGAEPAGIAFGANMTTLTYHLSRALGRDYGPGDEIVITELDHHANVAPWQALEKERGITLRTARMDPASGELDWDHLEQCFTGRTRLLAIGAASNAIGTINDVRRAAELARARGATVFVDAVHYAPHALVDVRALDCDFLACSAYKFYGPHVGILYGRPDRIQALDAPRLAPAPDHAPDRLETGTQNHEGIAGAAAAVEFLASIGTGSTRRERLHAAFDALHHRAADLLRRLWDGLAAMDDVHLYGPPPDRPRTATVGFTIRGIPAAEVARRLAEHAIFVSHGDFYAATVIDRLGLAPDGLVRAGCACYTTPEEIDRLVAAVGAIAAG